MKCSNQESEQLTSTLQQFKEETVQINDLHKLQGMQLQSVQFVQNYMNCTIIYFYQQP